jgi:hypothetical protein
VMYTGLATGSAFGSLDVSIPWPHRAKFLELSFV